MVNRVVNTMPLSVSVEYGMPCTAVALVNSLTTMVPVTRWCAVTESASGEQSSSQHRISMVAPLASRQWVKSACQRSFGC